MAVFNPPPAPSVRKSLAKNGSAGTPPEAARRAELQLRVVSAAVMGPVILALAYLGGWTYIGAVILILGGRFTNGSA